MGSSEPTWTNSIKNKNYDLTCGLCDREKETSYHIYAECSEMVLFRARKQKTLGEILRWFSDKSYLMHLYDTNKLEYEELKTMSAHRGHEGQTLPDIGWQTSLTTWTDNGTTMTTGKQRTQDPGDLFRRRAQICSEAATNGVALDREQPSSGQK